LIGVKCWVYQGEKVPQRAQAAASAEA